MSEPAKSGVQATQGAATVTVSYTLLVPGELITVNGTRGKHWSAYGPLVKLWRRDARLVALAAQVPHCDKVRIIAVPMQCRGRLADPGAHAVCVKAAVDGLVDAGVIDDDDGSYVECIIQMAPERVKARDEGIRIVIEEVK